MSDARPGPAPGPDDPRHTRDLGEPTPRGRPDAGAQDARCELCGGPLMQRHCKILCLNCGYQRDCSDP